MAQLACKVYVGDLPKDAREKELHQAFEYYGNLRSVWVARNPAGFAFVEFEDARDAENAVRALDGTKICGGRARVELSTGKIRPKPGQRGRGGYSGSSSRQYSSGYRGSNDYDSRDKRNYRSRSRSPERYRRKRSRSDSRERGSGRHRSRSGSDHTSSRNKRSRSDSAEQGSGRNRSRSRSGSDYTSSKNNRSKSYKEEKAAV